MTETKHLRAYLRVHLAAGVGAIIFRRLIEAFGDAETAVAASQGQLKAVQGVGVKIAAGLAAVTDEQIDAELDEARRCGVEILCAEDEAYPAALKTIYDYPPVLYVRGRLEPTDAVAMAIVGARRCTYYGMEQAERFGQLLGRAGFTIVSGGARGIDTAAHHGALSCEGRTIAVMGCGLRETYPSDNEKLFEQILATDSGAIISELPMSTAVKSENFPRRNRIISGLSLGVLVVEAARRSGALITARLAAEQGRDVFVLPGRVDSPLSQGANELIRDGAILTQNLEDILEHLGEVGRKMAPPEAPATQPVPAGLDAAENTLLAALRPGSLSMDELARRTGLDSGKVASAMTMLVLKGLIVQRPGNIFAIRTRRGTS